LEKGFNDKADRRNIVIHGSKYVGEEFIKSNKFNGRSFGCPAVPNADVKDVIEDVKGGSCFFIYHPTKKVPARFKNTQRLTGRKFRWFEGEKSI